MRAYIERFHDRSKIDFLHPVLKELLEETFGVMVFQEDVIKVAHYFGGLDLGEADVLRRAMKLGSGSKFQLVKDKYMASCAKMGHTKELATEVCQQMERIAG